MAFSHGSKAAFLITDVGGVERDISAFLTGVDFEPTADMAETTTLGKASKTYISGIKDGKFSVEGKYDPTPDGYLEGILGDFGTARTFKYGPTGSTAGLTRYTGTCFLVGYRISTPVSDAASFSATFQVTGDVTRDTF